MINNESDYKASLRNIQEHLNKLKPTDLHIRYLYRYDLEDQSNGNKIVEYITENMELKDNIRGDILEKLKKELKGKLEEKIELHNNYKLNFKINQGQIGILNEESYPEELKRLISSMQRPSSDGKSRSNKETKIKNKIPVAFAIGFDGVLYVKRISKIKVMSGKKLKNSYLAGTKSHKITTLDEDFLVLTFIEPDMIIYTREDGSDPTFIYNSHNFNIICATPNYMLGVIKNDKMKIEEVIDKADSLIDYLEGNWMCVSSAYFMINRNDFKKFEQSYIDKLNGKAPFNGRLRLNQQSMKLETDGLTGKEIYNIILAKYGNEYTLDGGEKPIIVESYSEVN